MRDRKRQQQERKAVDQHEPVHARFLEVTADQTNGDFDKMLRRFTKKVREDGILQLSVEKSSFVKPSEARRKKTHEAAKNAKKARG